MNAAPDLLCHKVTADINHPGPPLAGFPLRFPFKKFWLIFNWPSCAGIDHALHRKTGIRRLWLPGVARQTCQRAREAVFIFPIPKLLAGNRVLLVKAEPTDVPAPCRCGSLFVKGRCFLLHVRRQNLLWSDLRSILLEVPSCFFFWYNYRISRTRTVEQQNKAKIKKKYLL